MAAELKLTDPGTLTIMGALVNEADPGTVLYLTVMAAVLKWTDPGAV